MKAKFIALLLIGAAAAGFKARDGVKEVAGTAIAQAPKVESKIERLPPVPIVKPTQVNKSAKMPISVQWVKEAEAKASGKTVLYLVTKSKNCGGCVKLKGFLDNPASIEAMNRFACVLIQDPPGYVSPITREHTNPWMRFYGVQRFPTMVFVGPKGTRPFVQDGAPSGVPQLLHFLDAMEKRFNGEPLPVVVPDSTKAFIEYPRRPTLAPAPHDTAAPLPEGPMLPIKGRSSEAPGRSVVKFVQRGGKCFQRSSGTIFRGGCQSCR